MTQNNCNSPTLLEVTLDWVLLGIDLKSSIKQREAEAWVAHLSSGVSLVPAGHLFGCSIRGGLVSCLVPATLPLCGSLAGSRTVDSFQVPCLGLLCQLQTNLPLRTKRHNCQNKPYNRTAALDNWMWRFLHQREQRVAAYLLLGQVLLQHDVHVRPDLQLGVRRFAPCAKEHQQEQRTLISMRSGDPRDYKHSKHKHSQLTLTLFTNTLTYVPVFINCWFTKTKSYNITYKYTLVSLTYSHSILMKNKQIHREKSWGCGAFFKWIKKL